MTFRSFCCFLPITNQTISLLNPDRDATPWGNTSNSAHPAPDRTLFCREIQEPQLLIFELITVEEEKPQALKDSRLTFHQILCIAEPLLWHKDSEWVWSSCRKLNSIRNSFSHELEPSKLEKNIKEFLSIVEKRYPPYGGKIGNIRANLVDLGFPLD